MSEANELWRDITKSMTEFLHSIPELGDLGDDAGELEHQE